MRKTCVTYAELKALLLDLGFRDLSGTGLPRFEYFGTQTVLLFRAHRSNELVSERDMSVVSRQLVDNGLIEAAVFDRFLHKATA